MKAKNTVIGKRKQAHRENRQRCECGHVKYNHIGNGRCCAPTCFCKNFIPEVLPKPSDIFEGENSSLKKTFDNATMPTSKETELRQRWSIASFELPFASPKEAEIVADWFIKELSLALEEKIKEVEKLMGECKCDSCTTDCGGCGEPREYCGGFGKCCDGKFCPRNMALNEVIKILKQ